MDMNTTCQSSTASLLWFEYICFYLSFLLLFYFYILIFIFGIFFWLFCFSPVIHILFIRNYILYITDMCIILATLFFLMFRHDFCQSIIWWFFSSPLLFFCGNCLCFFVWQLFFVIFDKNLLLIIFYVYRY